MTYLFKGNLAGYICDDCIEKISHVKIFLFLPSEKTNITAAAIADAKDTFKLVTPEQAKEKSSRLIGEGITDEEGNFSIEINKKYSNTAFEFDFVCGTVPRPPFPPKKAQERHFHITTVYPQWRGNNKEESIYFLKYYIPYKWWCFIKGHFFDLWTICGRLVHCKTGKPLPGIKVTAMDADLFTDDNLGSDTTDSNGHFTIYYTSMDFKKTFLSPWINVETDLTSPFFSSGPDVYFKLEYNGQPIVFETAANRRNNVGYCLCVKLCVENIDVPDSEAPASFTHFGLLRRIGIVSEISTVTGKTNRPSLNGYAFFSSVHMIGTITRKLNGQPMEYLFEFQEVASPSTPIVPGAWQPVLPNMINKTKIGYLWTVLPDGTVDTEPYYINGTGTEKTVTFNGNWIKVPQDANFAPHSDAEILRLDTEKLMPVVAINMSMAPAAIGSSTVSPSRPHTHNRFFAIRMRKRQAGNAATETGAGTSRPTAVFNARYNNVNRFGSWAPATVNNQIAAASVDIQEIVAGTGGCSKIVSALHVKYGARNENLSAVSLSITGPAQPGQSFGFAPIALMPAPETFGTAQLVFTPASHTVNDLLPCAYTVTFSATVLLTTGDGEAGQVHDFVSFCKV